jgi:hypothetical protein
MIIGLSLGIGSTQSGGGAPESLYDTGDFTGELDAAYREILAIDSFRVVRIGATQGRYMITGVPSGTYRISGTPVTYDGAIGGVVTNRFAIADGFTNRVVPLVSAGPFSHEVLIASGTLRFLAIDAAGGARVNDLFIEAV